MNNKDKTARIHDLMPKYFKTQVNPNWKALIETIGESDQNIADLIEEVRKQFFVKTASRPYIDRLGANSMISRPKFIGMDDSNFRQYIPVLAYQPKQVKIIIDQLLDIFFFKESTTAFLTSSQAEPYFLKDGWELTYLIDAYQSESIIFSAADFADIAAATADEIVAAINRQAQNSFAVVYDDSITHTRSVRLFTTTVGAKGSLQMQGGRANISLQFQGFNTVAGNQATTQWTISKIGDSVTLQYVGGSSPNLAAVQVGDIVVVELPGNEGSFAVTSIDLANQKIFYTNSFATAGTFDHAVLPETFVKFFTPDKVVIYTKNLRAVAWEVQPGEIVIEMPASPPIVRRQLAGSAHVNGTIAYVAATGTTTLTLDDAADWPVAGGHFVLKPLNEVTTHVKTGTEDIVTVFDFESRFDRIEQYYSYTSRSGNVLSGITPALPEVSAVHEATITTAIRDGANIVTATTVAPHGFYSGEALGIRDSVVSGPMSDPVNGAFMVLTVPTPTSFTYRSFGDAGTSLGGTATVERVAVANAGSMVYLTSARLGTGITGPYMWNLSAPFVLSSLSTSLTASIQAGDALRSVEVVGPNQIPSADGYLIFDFGTEREEGPIRYLYKANDQTINIDPAYVFQYNHDVGSAVSMIRRKGPHTMSGSGNELPLYVTDPSAARAVLQDLIKQVKSVGIFLNFIVRYPVQYYATLDCYKSGIDPG